MTRSLHIAYASWIFGAILLVFMLVVFWLAPDSLPYFKQQVLAYLSALSAGLFGFFLTGDIALAVKHKESSTSLKAAGGIALFVLVLAWWQYGEPPIKADTNEPTTHVSDAVPNTNQSLPPTPAISPIPVSAPPSVAVAVEQQDSSIHSDRNLKIKATDGAENQVITGNGQIVKGSKTTHATQQHKVAPSKSGISSKGDLEISASGKGSKVTVITGNGQIYEGK